MSQRVTPPSPAHVKPSLSRLCASLGFAATLMFTAGAVQAASFPCKNAQTATEKHICGDKDLGALDVALARAYQNRRDGDENNIGAEQKNWIKNVRDNCTSVGCLKSAYRERIKVLNGSGASFNCELAKSATEQLICGDEGLRYADRTLAQSYLALNEAGGDRKQIAAEQNAWLHNVRQPCASVACLKDVIDARNGTLGLEREELDARIKKEIGYSKTAFYSDTRFWPKDPSRIIALYATQESAAKNHHDEAQQDEDYILDIYVLDSATRKVLQHGNDSVSSDAIALQSVNIDNTDYSPLLGVQAFGINASHTHYGCAGYESDSVRLYALEGKTMRPILSDIALRSNSGMCGTECESKTIRRELRFPDKSGKRYPDLLVRVKTTEAREAASRKKSVCKVDVTRQDYTLRHDAAQYKVPGGLDY